MIKNRFLAAVTVALVSYTTPVAACEGGSPLQSSFLSNLPREGLNRPVVALVEIVEQNVLNGEIAAYTITTVSVIEPIFGASRNDVLTVVALDTECSIEQRVKAGEQYFISGVAEETVFDGSWPDAAGRFDD